MDALASLCWSALFTFTGQFTSFNIVASDQEVFIAYSTEQVGDHTARLVCAELVTDEGQNLQSYSFVNKFIEHEISGAWLPWNGVRCTFNSTAELHVMVCAGDQVVEERIREEQNR